MKNVKSVCVLVSCLLVATGFLLSCFDKSHAEPKVALVYSQEYEISFGGLERFSRTFDLHKSQKIHQQLLADKVIQKSQVYKPDKITKEEILKAQSKQFLDSLGSKEKIAKYLFFDFAEFLSLENLHASVLRPMRYATGGTLLASRLCLKSGIAINLGGGFHHAGPDAGEGACIYADIPIAIRVLQSEKLIKKALVIDLDAHQGNGTALCLADDDSTYTFSMHQGNIYPIPKAKSDLDVELPAGMKDEAFLIELDKHLDGLFDKGDFDIVFYMAGCDNIAGDPMAGLSMTAQGIVKRDIKVFEACVKRRIPVVMVLGGGMTKTSWQAQHGTVAKVIKTYGLHFNQSKIKKP